MKLVPVVGDCGGGEVERAQGGRDGVGRTGGVFVPLGPAKTEVLPMAAWVEGVTVHTPRFCQP